jgi:hypothetical protein
VNATSDPPKASQEQGCVFPGQKPPLKRTPSTRIERSVSSSTLADGDARAGAAIATAGAASVALADFRTTDDQRERLRPLPPAACALPSDATTAGPCNAVLLFEVSYRRGDSQHNTVGEHGQVASQLESGAESTARVYAYLDVKHSAVLAVVHIQHHGRCSDKVNTSQSERRVGVVGEARHMSIAIDSGRTLRVRYSGGVTARMKERWREEEREREREQEHTTEKRGGMCKKVYEREIT